MGWTAKESGFDFQQGQGTFLFFTASRLALEPTLPMGTGAYIHGGKAARV
jgi:hypothetical protein